MIQTFIDSIKGLLDTSGFSAFTWQHGVMIFISLILIYLAVKKQYEPMLLLPIAFGMLLTNLPLAGMYHPEIFINSTGHIDWTMFKNGEVGLIDLLYLGVKLGI